MGIFKFKSGRGQSSDAAGQFSPAVRDTSSAERSLENHVETAAALRLYFAVVFSLMLRRSGHCQCQKDILTCKQGRVSLLSLSICVGAFQYIADWTATVTVSVASHCSHCDNIFDDEGNNMR